jgi:geranylgeranyl pyrophosphate synthase
MLEDSGAREYATRQAERLTRQAVDLLKKLRPRGEAGAALRELTERLLTRQS